MVDTFEKNYKGLQIAYPGDQGRLAEIDAQAAVQKQRYTRYHQQVALSYSVPVR